ncbi:flippase [Geopsychrobacter electrodiphilus]|uniref:flippase n=1 Tax=Geopsychrobacter electrodiphilus TaxID=225196 RepID=UPI000379BE8F|nr:flippase [Geopsychrobacter electrodiphilus]
MLGSFFKSFASLTAGRIVGLVFALLSASLLARGLGPEDFGTLTLVLLIPTSVQALSGLSLNSGVVHFAAKHRDCVRYIFGAAAVLNSIVALIQLLLTLVVSRYLGEWLVEGLNIELVYLAAILSFPSILVNCQADALLNGTQEFHYLGRFASFTAPLLPLGYFILILTQHLTVTTVLWVNSIVALLIALVRVRKCKVAIGFPVFNNFLFWAKKILLYGIVSHMSNVIAFFNYRLDMFILNSYMGKVTTGFYSVAVSIAEKLWLVSSVCSQIVFSKISGMDGEKDMQRLTRIVGLSTFAITALGSVVLGFLASFMVNLLFGSAFSAAAEGIRWLLPGICAMSVGRIYANDLAGRGKPKYNIYLSAITLIVNIGLNIVLIPQMGIVGAAIATSTSYSVAAILAYIAFRHEISKVKVGNITLPSSPS